MSTLSFVVLPFFQSVTSLKLQPCRLCVDSWCEWMDEWMEEWSLAWWFIDPWSFRAWWVNNPCMHGWVHARGDVHGHGWVHGAELSLTTTWRMSATKHLKRIEGSPKAEKRRRRKEQTQIINIIMNKIQTLLITETPATYTRIARRILSPLLIWLQLQGLPFLCQAVRVRQIQ